MTDTNMTELVEALRDLDEVRVHALVEEKIQAGVAPMEIVAAANEGIVAVGELFSDGTYFISQLIFSSEILKAIMARLEPLLAEGGDAVASGGTIVIGTVKGDIHDIGKNILITLLRSTGFEIVDLGVDVPAEKFVQALRDSNAKAVGMSALLNFTYPEMKNVVDTIAAAGLRDKVQIVIGGTPVNEDVRAYSGADFYAKDAVDGVNIFKKIHA